MPSEILEALEPLAKASRDIVSSSKLMGRAQARYLVDLYYQIQDMRIRAAGQLRSGGEEPAEILKWTFNCMETTENTIRNSLGKFAKEFTVGIWLQSICGIGPVISAGMLAHLDVTKTKVASGFWRFAGLEPSVKWEKGQKRPFNAALKVLCWKAGESFVKVQNNDSDFYGKMFAKRRELEQHRNDSGLLVAEAERATSGKKYRKETNAFKAYSEGKLPDAHLHARARRYAVKFFLGHVFHCMYEDYYETSPPLPFIIGKPAKNGCTHTDFVPPPNWPPDKTSRSLRELLTEPPSRNETSPSSEANVRD